MAWVKITKDQHILPRLNNTEMAGYEDAVAENPYASKIPDLIKQVTDRFRGAIQSCKNNTSFGASCTVPEECVYHAVSLIKRALVASNPNTNELQGTVRDSEYTAAETYLERVADCKEVISPDSGATGDSTTAGIEWGSKTALNFSL
tara:strand:- start:2444 stop:2884 length:441 start_codon:yes stop_codon:yes gene_type:complete